jgi:hypothetical protein
MTGVFAGNVDELPARQVNFGESQDSLEKPKLPLAECASHSRRERRLGWQKISGIETY